MTFLLLVDVLHLLGKGISCFALRRSEDSTNMRPDSDRYECKRKEAKKETSSVNEKVPLAFRSGIPFIYVSNSD